MSEIKRLRKMADKIYAKMENMQRLTDSELKGKTDEFKLRLKNGETVDQIMPDAYAAVGEAAYRSIGLRPYKVQIMGAIALNEGKIAEQKTGEGKTLTASMPAYLNALEGKGVHIVTVNDYLAERDAEDIGRIHRFMGLTVGCILKTTSPEEKKKEYAKDITLHHHEKYNGTGYPEGLKGDEITIISRIMAIIDVYDALANDRVYKKAMPPKEVEEYIVSQSGTAFDPKLINVFLLAKDELARINKENQNKGSKLNHIS